MTESQFTAKLLRALRSQPALREAVIFKHNDRTTRGIPDFSISIGEKTLWAEVKRFPNPLTKIQLHFINKLRAGCLIIVDRGSNSISLQQQGLYDVFTFDQLVGEIVRRCIDG